MWVRKLHLPEQTDILHMLFSAAVQRETAFNCAVLVFARYQFKQPLIEDITNHVSILLC